MTNYQEKRTIELLDSMAESIVMAKPGDRDSFVRAVAILHYLIWESRKILDLPDFPGLDPL
jgi:hypothetical protein